MANPIIRKQKYNVGAPTTQPTPLGYQYGEIASGDVPTPAAGTTTMFRDSLDGELKTKDENGVLSPLGSGSGGGLQPVFIDHTTIPSELVRNRIYEADFSAAPATLGKTLTLTGMTDSNYDQDYAVAGVYGTIDVSDNFVFDTTNKVFYYEAVPATTWYVVVKDENDDWIAYNSDTDPTTWTDALALTLSLGETIVSTNETQDNYFVPNSVDAKVSYSGNPANVLTVVFPEGTGSETFIIGFRITGLADGITVSFETTNSQNIFLPDATTTTTITGINAKTYFEFAWDQSRYVYGDVDSPTFANLAASLGDVEVDTLTVGTSIIGGEATATQAGTVLKNKIQKKVLVGDISATTSDIVGLKFNGLTIGKTYKAFVQYYIEVLAGSGTDYLLGYIKHNGSNIAGLGYYANGVKDEQVSATRSTEVVFEATSTTVEFACTIVGDVTLQDANSYTYSIIEELNNAEITTDFT